MHILATIPQIRIENNEEGKNFNQISTMKKYVAKNHYKNSKGLLNINAKKKKKLHLPTLNFMDSKEKK